MTNLTKGRLSALIEALRFRLNTDTKMSTTAREDAKLALKWAREQHDRRDTTTATEE